MLFRSEMQKVPASKMEHDVCGHYARPDVLELFVDDSEDDWDDDDDDDPDDE